MSFEELLKYLSVHIRRLTWKSGSNIQLGLCHKPTRNVIWPYTCNTPHLCYRLTYEKPFSQVASTHKVCYSVWYNHSGIGNRLLLRTTPSTLAFHFSNCAFALSKTSHRSRSASTTKTTPSHRLASLAAERASLTAGISNTT